ncbi:hypothetical protein LCGC14_1124720 [marine sediment metagenome]|uniref:Uncharacterized protein n=1 Tax=marine sediment metagenome TaxID=412755 RepID=A0A0F9PL00_9ZZZZ
MKYFEYHCYEGHDSTDAELWYRSHQRVTVLGVEVTGAGDTPEERGDNGEPRVYHIQFKDGHKASAFEDELMSSTVEFCRPDPPRRRG